MGKNANMMHIKKLPYPQKAIVKISEKKKQRE